MRHDQKNQYFGCLRHPGSAHLPLSGFAVTIGRELGQCEVTVNDQTVSRLHCMIYRSNNGVYVEDLDSSNGTWLNGQRISKHRLRDGEFLHFGQAGFVFELAQEHAVL